MRVDAMTVAVLESGMVTSVGLDAPSSCAAIRAGISGFTDLSLEMDGEPLVGCPVSLDASGEQRDRLIALSSRSVSECLSAVGDTPPSEIPLLLCVAESARPGRPDGLDDSFLRDLQINIDAQLHTQTALIADGGVGGVRAIERAGSLLAGGCPYCVVAGVDSFLPEPTLTFYLEKGRLKTERNSDGFIPGEASAAVLLGPTGAGRSGRLECLGIGFGEEEASVDSESPLRADGMVAAIRAALASSDRDMADLDYRITDLSGEQYGFKEAALALTRILRKRKEEFDIWHPSECVGEVGAAIVPCVLGVALSAARKDYAPGPQVLCHFASDGGDRAAMVLRYENGMGS
jgi:3-oxoacyl-[acyl-carrier-protein] synthase-1